MDMLTRLSFICALSKFDKEKIWRVVKLAFFPALFVIVKSYNNLYLKSIGKQPTISV